MKDNKKIEDIKTLRELIENYYLISKDIELDNDLLSWLEENNQLIEDKILNSINLVKRGRMKKKLTKEQIQEIKQSNKTNAELGKIYNVSASTISAVKNNKY